MVCTPDSHPTFKSWGQHLKKKENKSFSLSTSVSFFPSLLQVTSTSSKIYNILPVPPFSLY